MYKCRAFIKRDYTIVSIQNTQTILTTHCYMDIIVMTALNQQIPHFFFYLMRALTLLHNEMNSQAKPYFFGVGLSDFILFCWVVPNAPLILFL